MISRSVYTVSTGRRLFWAGLGCVALTVVLFFGGFLVGNSFSPEFSLSLIHI